MAKFAEKSEKTFSPIADKLIEAVGVSEARSPEHSEERPPEKKVVAIHPEPEAPPQRGFLLKRSLS